ncbi:hypothetical protein BPY_14320 [Bifidobacterium psychraerophilum]|uniref:hypothetical protein n=1 Tax=Bifidobacterium psychraerophilum TaxID=218140 RepID=UPI00310EA986
MSDPLAGIVLMALAGFSPYTVYRFLSFVGVDFCNQMGAKQDAKSTLNRPVPIPTQSSSEGPAKILDGSSAGGGAPSGPLSGGPTSTTATAGAGASG